MNEMTDDVMAEWIRSALPGLIAEYKSRNVRGSMPEEWPKFQKGISLFLMEKATATFLAA